METAIQNKIVLSPTYALRGHLEPPATREKLYQHNNLVHLVVVDDFFLIPNNALT